MRDWLRRLPPNVQGALWLVSGGFIFTSTGAMIRLLSDADRERADGVLPRRHLGDPAAAPDRRRPGQAVALQAHRRPFLAHR